ncbi:hypothetical protein ANO11243_049250 [Dothideomycetidae sp. 11243]|nr:hypothetical protein ANO11243_049250 [fungal sp. No.11243]
MRFSSIAAVAATAFGAAQAQYKGFNYGTASGTGAPYTEQDFVNLFNAAAGLTGAPDFTSARMYTMIQAGTQNTVVSAIPAALSTGTHLLLGLFVSGGDAEFQNELTALKTAISQFPNLASQLVGISVGSEDLYRISPIAAQQGNTLPGAEPAALISYIQQVRSAIAGTAWANAPVGHVDTWTAFANGSNDGVAGACDFVGVDAYPYFQNVDANDINNGLSLFQTALNSLTATAKSKSVWITETGWPVSGPTENQAVPGLSQAKQYWDAVGCGFLFGKYNTWWYTLQDYGSSPSFGVVGSTLGSAPLYDLSCSSSSSSSSSAAATSTTSAAAKGSTTTAVATSAPPATSSAAAKSSSAAAPSSGAGSASYDATVTVKATTLVTVTSCPPGASSAAPAPATSAPSTPSTSGCPANLNGNWQYPHLIVPVSSSSPNTAYGTQYFGTINSTVSSIFNFDIPASYAGKTCSVVSCLTCSAVSLTRAPLSPMLLLRLLRTAPSPA